MCGIDRNGCQPEGICDCPIIEQRDLERMAGGIPLVDTRPRGDLGNVGDVRQRRIGNYVEIHMPGHPLSKKNGWVLRHRFILWEFYRNADARGPATRPCRWCGWDLVWIDAVERCINVDHLNEIPGDDRVENLVVSCNWCNGWRSWAKRHRVGWVWEIERVRLKDTAPWDRPALPGLAVDRLVQEIEALTSETAHA